jgi:hypothetical protein
LFYGGDWFNLHLGLKMVFDKAIILIEHQENELFSVYHFKNHSHYWSCFVSDCTYDEAKRWVKLLKVAYEIVSDNANIDELCSAVVKLDQFIGDRLVNDKRLTAGKLYKLYVSQNGSL